MEPDISVYDAVGGMPFFVALVDRFYARIAHDIMLSPLYPDDLGPPAEHLALFLAQYWGGPTTYSDGRGHPRLRLRHAPFAIGQRERDRWLAAMTAALDAADLDSEVRQRFDDYFTMAADSLVNTQTSTVTIMSASVTKDSIDFGIVTKDAAASIAFDLEGYQWTFAQAGPTNS